MQLRGTVKRIIYSDEESSFYIFSLEDKDDALSIKKAKGSFVVDKPYPGQSVILTGEWQDTKYGPTFDASSMEPGELETTEGIRKYLEHYVESIGPVTAKRLTDHFGTETIRVLNTQPERLEEVPRLNKTQRENLAAEWSKFSQFRQVAIHLLDLSLSESIVKKVYARWGSECVATITDNPYCLMEIPGVGFTTADRVALEQGIAPDSPYRIGACIEYALKSASEGPGHLYLDPAELVGTVYRLIHKNEITAFGRKLTTQDIKAAFSDLKERRRIVLDKGKVYLTHHFDAEAESARLLSTFCGEHENFDIAKLEEFITMYEEGHEIQFSPEQQDAIRAVHRHKVLLLTGLPGTGKTTCTRALVNLFKTNNLEVKLLSPTGIAAKRLSNVTGTPASTIHRFLGAQRDGSWKFNADNQIVMGAVIVDEFSMVDMNVFYRLLSALQEDTILVFVGDHAQLPSVGAGNVLQELIASKQITRVNLTQIFRQEEASDIIVNAHRINAGFDPNLRPATDAGTDFKFISCDSEDEIQESILKVVKGIQGKAQRGTTFQVLSPRWKSALGVNNLNDRIKEVLNPLADQREVNLKGLKLRIGDRLIVTQNDYDKGIYNGEIGTLVNINPSNSEIEIRIRDFGKTKLVPIPYDEAKDLLNLAFCITIHKCVHPDTLVETPKGLSRIRDIPDSGMIATPDGLREYHGKVVNPSGPALRLGTKAGFSLTVTPEHGLDVWDADQGGYVRKEASHTTTGEFLRFRLGAIYDPSEYPKLPEPSSGDVREEHYSIPERLTPDVAEFFGMMVGDGCNFERGFRLVKRHPEVVQRFSTLCETLFEYKPNPVDCNAEATGGEVCSTFLSRWLSAVGGMEPHLKDVPAVVLQAPLECQRAFLRGLFEDASVHLKGSSFDHIQLSQKNGKMLDTVQTMLLRMGIIAHRKDYSIPSLYLYTDAARIFSEEIGFISQFKSDRISSHPISRTRGQVIPLAKGEAQSLWANHSDCFPNISAYQNAMNRGYLSRSAVMSIVEGLGELTPPWLKERLQYHHDRITVREPTECPSMCVEVPQGHRFLQNGCSGWNSQGQEYDYVIMPFVKRFSIQLQRNLLYTAVTRAKRKVFIFGDWQAIQDAVRNDMVTHRNTLLAERLAEWMESSSD